MRLFIQVVNKEGDAINLNPLNRNEDIPVATRSMYIDDEGNITIRLEYLHGQPTLEENHR